jgi:hypothetical protein
VIVRNWGKQTAELTLDGRKISIGKNFRQGIVARPEGIDLILWLRLESEKPAEISVVGQQ